jgi:DNA-binding CsgD family transcriptional regulator
MATWPALRDAVTRLAPLPDWRRSLAEGLYEATACPTLVFTSTPAGLRTAELASAPDDAREIGEEVKRQYAPRLTKAGGWVRQISDHGTVFASDAVRSSAIRWLHTEILAPRSFVGCVQGLAFAGAAGAPVVWLLLLCRRSPSEVLAELEPPLFALCELIGDHVLRIMTTATGFGCSPPAMAWARLSEREREVALLVARGFSNANVAHRAGMSESTVAVHVRHIYSKLSVHSRAELAAEIFGASDRER